MEEKYPENKENEIGIQRELSEKEVDLSPTSKMRKKLKEKQNKNEEESSLEKETKLYEHYSYAPKEEYILKWWKRHERVLPLLSNIAKRVLAIPASSAKSERVFSTGGNVVTKKRNSLAPKKVQGVS